MIWYNPVVDLLESQQDETSIVSKLYFNLNSILYYLHLNNSEDRRGKHHAAWTKEKSDE